MKKILLLFISIILISISSNICFGLEEVTPIIDSYIIAGTYTQPVSNTIDDNVFTFVDNYHIYAPMWVIYDLNEPEEILQFSIYGQDGVKTTSIKIEGSNDKIIWDTLHDQSGYNLGSEWLDIVISGTYRYYKITVVCDGVDIRLGEVKFYTDDLFNYPTPSYGSTNNTQQIINVSCYPDQVTLWFDDNINPITVIDGFNNTSPFIFNTNVTIEQKYYYKASCDAGLTNSSIRTWTYDTTSPAILIKPNNFFTSDNSSSLSRIQANKNLDINITDNIDLFGFLINISQYGLTKYSNSSESLSGLSYNIKDYVNFTDWDLGLYNVSVTVTDSHTANKINDYKVSKKNKELIFDTDEGNNIKLLSDSNSNTNTIKNKDRYNIIFNFDDKKKSQKRVFTLESNNKIRYIENSKYKAHFVIWNSDKKEGNWVDFEGVEEEPKIVKINDYSYNIIFNNLGDRVTFNSIGGLNTKTQDFTFNLSTIYPFNPKLYVSNQLDWNYSGEFNILENISVSTEKINNILNSNCDCQGCLLVNHLCRIPLIFNSETTGLFNVTLNNLTVFTNLTFNIYDRVSGDFINQNIKVSILNGNNYTTSNGILTIPDFSTNQASYLSIISSEGYITEQKYFTLENINSKIVNVFLTNSSSENLGSLIVDVFDDFFNIIIGANIKLLEYDSGTSSFIEVSQCFSDSNGECIFDVELNTKYYIAQVTYIKDGKVYTAQSTENGQLIKIDQTIIELYLKISEDFKPSEIFDLIITPSNTELISNISYLTATFNDNSNTQHEVCIGYYTKNGLNEIEQTVTCINGSSGIINYAGGYALNRDYTYIAKIYIINSEGKKIIYNEYIYEAEEDTFLSEWGSYLVKAIIFAIILFILAVSLYLKKINIFAIGMIGFSPFSLILHPNLMGGITMSFIIILCLCILYLTGKKQDFG